MSHPLYTMPEEEFVELLTRTNPPQWAEGRMRELRKGVVLSDADRQAVFALWHNLLPEPDGFRWPWASVDRMTGPLPIGDLAVVLAQTGSGKTTFTASLLNQTQKRALVFATEIPDDRYLSALASRRAGLHPDKVQQGMWDSAGWRMSADEARQRHRTAVYELSQGDKVVIAPHLRLRASRLRTTLRKEAEKAVPELVVVDHFQAIVHDLADGVSGVQATLEVLQDFAIDAHTTVIVTNQVHVRGQGGLPPKATDCVHLAGVFGGQALGQAASQILGVHRTYVETFNGQAVTKAFLQEWHKGNGKDSDLWDRTKVEIDFPKIRYDANGNSGNHTRLTYESGVYVEP